MVSAAQREERRQRWTALAFEGMPLAEIGRTYGVSRERVRQVIGSGIPRRLKLDTFADALALLRRDPTIDSWASWAARSRLSIPVLRTWYRPRLPSIFRLWRARRTQQGKPIRGAPAHGTRGRYLNRCRCALCRTANSARRQAWIERRRAANDYEHGVATAMQFGCRCERCTTFRRSLIWRTYICVVQARHRQKRANA